MKDQYLESQILGAGRSYYVTRGVTLLELLVVAATITLLMGLLLPGLGRARDQARSVVCGSNIRQLANANAMYAQDAGGMYVPGAVEIVQKNLHRWHGVRKKKTEPFDSLRGPLVPYLGVDAAIRACPAFVPDRAGFEKGNGGYGYNNAYIGVQVADDFRTATRAGARVHQVKRPADTLMFADAAFVDGSLIEYSFAEPRFHPQFQNRADPSIHFRHAHQTNIAWCDGHVASERRTFTYTSGIYEGNPERHNIGWFGLMDDNTYFDLQ